jgi:hypothetical protein
MISSFFVSVAYQFYAYYLVGYAVALRRMHEAQTGIAIVPLSKKEKRSGGKSVRAAAEESARHNSATDFPEPSDRAHALRAGA